uniref:Uncharacterized protein n=1 Tax=Arundo donax TaxID=35708 RepID=A0A0A9BAM8_ARUDO
MKLHCGGTSSPYPTARSLICGVLSFTCNLSIHPLYALISM